MPQRTLRDWRVSGGTVQRLLAYGIYMCGHCARPASVWRAPPIHASRVPKKLDSRQNFTPAFLCSSASVMSTGPGAASCCVQQTPLHHSGTCSACRAEAEQCRAFGRTAGSPAAFLRRRHPPRPGAHAGEGRRRLRLPPPGRGSRPHDRCGEHRQAEGAPTPPAASWPKPAGSRTRRARARHATPSPACRYPPTAALQSSLRPRRSRRRPCGGRNELGSIRARQSKRQAWSSTASSASASWAAAWP